MQNGSAIELKKATDELFAALERAKMLVPAEIKRLLGAIISNLTALLNREYGIKPLPLDDMIKPSAKTAVYQASEREPSESEKALRNAAIKAKNAGYKADEAFEMGGIISADALRQIKKLSKALDFMAEAVHQIESDSTADYGVVDADLPEKKYLQLSSEAAVEFCKILNARAKELGTKVVSAVCDAGGNLVAFIRDDDAFIASIDIAINKAYTAVALKMETEKLAELAAPNGPLYGIQQTNGGKIVIFGGGAPIYRNGEIIGGFGVSGGTAEFDTEMAHFGSALAKKWFS